MSVPPVSLLTVTLVTSITFGSATTASVAAVRDPPSSVTTSIARRVTVDLGANMPWAASPAVAVTPASGLNVIVYLASAAPRFESTIRWL